MIYCYLKVQMYVNIIFVLAVDDRHVAFCEYNRSVARKICVAVATLALTSCFGLMADSAVVDSALVDAALRKSGLI